MKRHEAMKSVSRKDTGAVERKEAVERRTWSLEKRMEAAMRDFERMVEETVHSPLFSRRALPFGHLFRTWDSTGDFTPAIDVIEEKGELVVKADLPGLSREDIAVKLVDNNLIITGEKKTEEKVERDGYLRMERSHGSFHRTLRLPDGIDGSSVSAHFKNGVLEIRMRKKEEPEHARTIAVE